MPIYCGLAGWNFNNSQGGQDSHVGVLGNILRHQLPNYCWLFNDFKAKLNDFLGVSQKVLLRFLQQDPGLLGVLTVKS